jgi:sugar phosphate isomerase/epimerase
MILSLHQYTSANAGFRKSLEGWARVGIKNVEVTAALLLDEFLRTDTLAAAGRLISDLGLTAVSAACIAGLWEPNPNRGASIESLKKRCEMFASMGLSKLYAPTTATQKFTTDDYKTGAQNMREVGEIVKQFRLTAMVEVVRASSFVSTLPTLLKMTARGCASESVPDAGLLSFLVWPEQISKTWS